MVISFNHTHLKKTAKATRICLFSKSQMSLLGTAPPSHSKVAIIGSGPAGHTAAVYLARANLEPVMFEGFLAGGVAPGGQLTTTTEVENYPGFPDGISGPQMMEKFRAQSVKFGTKIFTETINKVDFSVRPFKLYREWAPSAPITADAVIIATGATARRLGLKGEPEYWNHGISACAVCDGALPMFRDQPVAVVGGGDTAAEESLFLTRYASRVHVLHRRDKLRASKVMAERLLQHPKVQMHWNTVAVEACGNPDEPDMLGAVKVKNVVTDEVTELKVAGLFYGIGHDPNTKFVQGQIDLHEDGYVAVQRSAHAQTLTNVPGVFACGDVQDKRYRQAITAAGSGCMAALDCIEYLETSQSS